MTIEQILKKLDIYTLAEAAKKLNMKSDTLLKQCQKGKHKALKVGNTWLIYIGDDNVDTWLGRQW